MTTDPPSDSTPGAALELHLPDEPFGHKARWAASVLDGRPLASVVGGDNGVAVWLWRRWRALGAAGVTEAWLRQVAVAYRREIGLWLAGDRSWAQCCAGLLGRIERRLPKAP